MCTSIISIPQQQAPFLLLVLGAVAAQGVPPNAEALLVKRPWRTCWQRECVESPSSQTHFPEATLALAASPKALQTSNAAIHLWLRLVPPLKHLVEWVVVGYCYCCCRRLAAVTVLVGDSAAGNQLFIL